jgi:hypothetical protein
MQWTVTSHQAVCLRWKGMDMTATERQIQGVPSNLFDVSFQFFLTLSARTKMSDKLLLLTLSLFFESVPSIIYRRTWIILLLHKNKLKYTVPMLQIIVEVANKTDTFEQKDNQLILLQNKMILLCTSLQPTRCKIKRHYCSIWEYLCAKHGSCERQ